MAFFSANGGGGGDTVIVKSITMPNQVNTSVAYTVSGTNGYMPIAINIKRPSDILGYSALIFTHFYFYQSTDTLYVRVTDSDTNILGMPAYVTYVKIPT